MNCTQAQALLAAYRELKNGKVLPLESADAQDGKSWGSMRIAASGSSSVAGSHFKGDTSELDAHLEQCAACRQVLAHNNLVGDKLRSLPAIEMPPEIRAKLMHTLTNEHLRFLQRSSFLKPSLQGQAQQADTPDLLTTFSTAETGPLPIIRLQPTRRRRTRMSQFAVVGIAAAFLMLLMMGGLTSLLLLGHGKLVGSTTSYISHSLDQPSNVAEAKYTTNTPFQHVVSAVADRSYIYYSAYSYDTGNPWMLEQLNRTTHASSPLLATASENPLIVLGSSNEWLVWLELDALKSVAHNNKLQHEARSFTRTWSLHYLSLTSLHQGPLIPLIDSATLFSGTFDESAAPVWVSTPVQGIWFLQDSLLVAMIDKTGNSHLLLFTLSSTDNLIPLARQIAPVDIADASAGHVFTSPTATNDGTSIYWSEEWRSVDGFMHSNIWAQQVLDSSRPPHGAWIDHTETLKYLFRSDGMSFRPQVVDNTLFMLSTADLANAKQSTTATATTPTPAPTVSTDTTPALSRVDPSIYGSSLDDSVYGAVLMLPINGGPTALPTQMNKAGQASSLQVGADFAVWQSEKGYEMYDVSTGYVNIGQDVLNAARFLAINGNTATWVADNTDNGLNSSNPSVTLIAFNWPEA